MFTKQQKINFAIFVNIIFPLAGMSTDIYLPSLPAMAEHFLVSHEWLQLTVTSYVIAMGIGQLFAGPISDALGRKKPLIYALFLQIFATIGILLSTSIYLILSLRFLQGIGAALMMVPARAVLNDIFTGEVLKKHFVTMTISFALAPIIAPYLGGYLQVYFGWQSNFIFILAYQVIVLLGLLLIYRETSNKKTHLQFQHFYSNYMIILKNKSFRIGVFFVSLLMGYVALFSIIGPFLIQTTLNKSPVFYGKISLLMGVAWFLGNLINRILFRYGEHAKTCVSLFGACIISVVACFWALYFPLTTLNVALPTFLLTLCSGFIFPIYVAESLMLFTALAASANAFLFSSTWFFYGFYTILATRLQVSSSLPFMVTCSIVSLICLYVYFVLYRRSSRTPIAR